MKGSLLLDTNILVLLAVGVASRAYIAEHKNTRSHFQEGDFDLVGLIAAEFSEILLIPHVVAEASNLIRQIGNPKRALIQSAFAQIVEANLEVPVPSVNGCRREEHLAFGVTDAVIIHLLSLAVNGVGSTLLTADGRLANQAAALGCSVIDYKREFG